MSDIHRNESVSSNSSLNSSSQDTEDDHTIAEILAEDEKLRHDGKLGKRLSHLDSIPHTPRVIENIPDVNDATLDHERLAERLCFISTLSYAFIAFSTGFAYFEFWYSFVLKMELLA